LVDIDELREPQIRLHGLTKANESYTFYHDETNNIRKLHVAAQGLNVAELKVFILGGVVHEGTPRPIDILPLRAAMRIQKTATEIKLEHVAKGDFLDLLRSAKLTTFLRWITDNGLMIHYHELDPLYWSIVDIVDSILLGNPELFPYHASLKSDLAAVLRRDLPVTISLFYRYGYPGLTPEGRKPFLKELIALIEHNGAALPEFNATMLKGVLQIGRGLDSLEFIEGYPPNLLIDDFSTFYWGRIVGRDDIPITISETQDRLERMFGSVPGQRRARVIEEKRRVGRIARAHIFLELLDRALRFAAWIGHPEPGVHCDKPMEVLLIEKSRIVLVDRLVILEEPSA
jgi:hypothetical protein